MPKMPMPPTRALNAATALWVVSPTDGYRALGTHDARFDGRFFTGVTSIGRCCRPVCRLRQPQREDFMPTPRWPKRPGLGPAQATRLLDPPAHRAIASVAALAQCMGISRHHLQRIFRAYLGVSPLQYLQTKRLLTAVQLLTDTGLPLTQVALMSGFTSVRRLSAAFCWPLPA